MVDLRCAPQPQSTALEIMAEEKNYCLLDSARTLSSLDGKNKWRYEIRTLQREFPSYSSHRIETALQKAIDSNPPSPSRREIELAARSDLVFQGLFVGAR